MSGKPNVHGIGQKWHENILEKMATVGTCSIDVIVQRQTCCSVGPTSRRDRHSTAACNSVCTDMPRLGKKNAWEQRGRGTKGRGSRPKGSRTGNGVLGSGQQAPSHQLGCMGERCISSPRGLGRSPSRNRIWCTFGLTIWHLVATILMIFVKINWPNFVQFTH